MIFRLAAMQDLPEIVALLADDPLGATRESTDMAPYEAAFEQIAANPMHQMLVAAQEGRIVATCQLTILHGLSHAGMCRALVEAVRVVADMRSKGIGAQMMAEVERRARAAGAGIIQLTTDKTRLRAHRFYADLGYSETHLGFKKSLR